jgi:hypothetical protein
MTMTWPADMSGLAANIKLTFDVNEFLTVYVKLKTKKILHI